MRRGIKAKFSGDSEGHPFEYPDKRVEDEEFRQGFQDIESIIKARYAHILWCRSGNIENMPRLRLILTWIGKVAMR